MSRELCKLGRGRPLIDSGVGRALLSDCVHQLIHCPGPWVLLRDRMEKLSRHFASRSFALVMILSPQDGSGAWQQGPGLSVI